MLNYNKDQSSRVIDAQNVAKKLIDDFIKKGALVSKRGRARTKLLFTLLLKAIIYMLHKNF